MEGPWNARPFRGSGRFPSLKPRESTDYILIGAGAAGCVLAARLSESAGISVQVLEAGPPRAGLMSKIPAALDFALKDDRFNWYYHTEPEPGMDHRRMYCPRGRMVGGSSSINGMMFVRGNPGDFDGWSEKGLPQWSYAHCLPYFKKMENYGKGGNEYRGHNGPLHVTPATLQTPLDQAFLEAGIEAGYAHSEDTNGFRQEGFGIADRNTYRGCRWGAAEAYLRPALGRPNLAVTTHARVHRILFDGTRATGVEYSRHGETRRLYAEREVILCGGSINSPQLLMLSGLGPAAHLAEHHIAVHQDMPGVGENLQDHLDLRVQVRCKQPVSLYPYTHGFGRILAGARWLLTRTGVCASNLFEVAGYVRTREDAGYPNLQSSLVAVAASYDGTDSFKGHGYQAHLDMMRPASRGRVRLKSANPGTCPAIRFNYLQEEPDRTDLVDALQITRNILRQDALAPYDGGEISPGPEVASDREILAWARASGETEYHPTGTCSMGQDDESVVDGDLKVHGMDGLRVVDASVMPTIVTANTHAATLMIAEKAADRILGKTPLPPLNVPVYQRG